MNHQQRRVAQILGYEPTSEDWTALEAFEQEAMAVHEWEAMTLIDHLKALPRRLPPLPMWVLMVLSWLVAAMAVVMFMDTAEQSRRVKEAERIEQLTLQRQQLQATQALVDEVRRLREALEGRER